MSKPIELESRPAFTDPNAVTVEVRCPRCGKQLTLWFNGGELDEQECCGLTHALEATGYRYVLYGKQEV